MVDVHRMLYSVTACPLYYRAEPVGSTNTVISELSVEHGYEILPTLAGLMALGLILDTRFLKCPTLTDKDKKICSEMAKIAGIDR